MSQKAKGKALPSASPFPTESTSGESKHSPIRVLIAEDNPADVTLVQMAFDHHALSAVFTVQSDGQEMLHHIAQIDDGELPCPDIVLLDLNLPRVKGDAILARLRQSPLCSKVPIVIVSSSNAPKDREVATGLGATDYFCKPNDLDHFMRLGAVVKGIILPS